MDGKREKKSISREEVEYVASLSRLELDEGQVDRFRGQLSDILSYIDQLAEVDTENITPTSHVLSSMKNVFREDELKVPLSNEKALSNAPEKSGNFFKVPKIIRDDRSA